ncbi:MAG: hypothetical protein J0H93_06585 [Chlamydiales bacterium]|nr:hypothetical protein [Chlamydiales bacterium]
MGSLEILKVLGKHNMNNKFTIELSSDLRYEDVVVEIMYNEETVATISQEKGLDKLEIEIFPPCEGKKWMFFFNDFLDALNAAKCFLLKMQKIPE